MVFHFYFPRKEWEQSQNSVFYFLCCSDHIIFLSKENITHFQEIVTERSGKSLTLNIFLLLLLEYLMLSGIKRYYFGPGEQRKQQIYSRILSKFISTK